MWVKKLILVKLLEFDSLSMLGHILGARITDNAFVYQKQICEKAAFNIFPKY